MIFPFFFYFCSFSLMIWKMEFISYIFGKNSKMEKIPMTTPVFTEASDAEFSKVSIKVCLPLDKDLSRWGINRC